MEAGWVQLSEAGAGGAVCGRIFAGYAGFRGHGSDTGCDDAEFLGCESCCSECDDFESGEHKLRDSGRCGAKLGCARRRGWQFSCWRGKWHCAGHGESRAAGNANEQWYCAEHNSVEHNSVEHYFERFG
jgi:hypothetical protein